MTKLVSHSIRCLAALVLVAFALAEPASANHDEQTYGVEAAKRVQRLVREMPTQTQVMSTATLLLALGIEPEESLKSLADSRDYFLGVLTGIRDGNPELGVVKETHEEVLEALAEVEESWVPFGNIVEGILETKQATAENVKEMARLNVSLLGVTEEVVEAFEEAYLEGRIASILLPMTEVAERQTLLIQKMAKEFFLVAHGQDAVVGRRSLGRTIKAFDRILSALISGEKSLRIYERDIMVVPPPTREIEAQLSRVKQIWDEVRPILKSAGQGTKPSVEDITQVAELVEPLYEEMESAADLYEDL